MTSDYIVRLIQLDEVDPSFHVDEDAKTITYVYSGDPCELVPMAQSAGEKIAGKWLIPVISMGG